MVTKTPFGNYVTVTVYENHMKYGEEVNEVKVTWSSLGEVSIEMTQRFNNRMLDALIFATAEEKRLGINK